ncbi:MAG TPA: hypothetical protein VN673_11035, partial [Clostridia bacterium]|nr:hypothetical protein [Clostridia bacterium]
PATGQLREEWHTMEATAPFDGVLFKVELEDEQGHKLSTEAIWDTRPWKREWLRLALADLKSCRFARFTDNFVRFNATPGAVDWADEADWGALADKAGHCAWLMKQAGGKGLAIDFEPYGKNPFQFDATQGRTFAETAALVRKRGAEFTRAIAREYPEAVLLTLFMNSINLKAGNSDGPDSILASSAYGLLPAFVDGMLEGAPAGMTLVDGCENGYYMDSAEEYLGAADEMRSWHGGAARLVSPENRAQYRRQVQAGFGFYLDMFLNESTNHYYRGPLNGSRLARLERNLAFARDAADEYVWIYGEQCRWWGKPQNLPHTVGKGRLWEEAMPGITRAIAYVRDPVRAARDEITKLEGSGGLTNLARNGDFTRSAGPQSGALPAEFSAWQHEKGPAGAFSWDAEVGDGAGCATRVQWGCLIQSYAVNPGEMYAVQADCLPRGKSMPTLVMRWQTAESRWTREPDDRTFAFQPQPGEWRRAFGVVTVPPGAGKLVVLLNVTGQDTDADKCWYDKLRLYRLR